MKTATGALLLSFFPKPKQSSFFSPAKSIAHHFHHIHPVRGWKKTLLLTRQASYVACRCLVRDSRDSLTSRETTKGFQWPSSQSSLMNAPSTNCCSSNWPGYLPSTPLQQQTGQKARLSKELGLPQHKGAPATDRSTTYEERTTVCRRYVTCRSKLTIPPTPFLLLQT